MDWEGPVTHRQYLAWQAWLDEEWNRPDRSDYYQMQTAADVRFKGRDVPTDFKLENMRIDFVDPREKERKQESDDVAYLAHLAKLRWAGRTGAAIVNRLTLEQQEWLESLSPEEALRERRRLAMLNKPKNGTGGK